MPHRASLRPGGHGFEVRDNETVLAAALRQGVHLPDGCRNGSCGVCRAHLATGRVRYPHGPPLGLTALECDAGYILLCRAVAETDMVLDAQEVAAAAELAIKTLPCRVARMQTLTRDVMALFLQLPPVEILKFLPGQYIDVLLPGGPRRSFSLANPPHDDAHLEIHVGLVPGGRFSEDVFSHMRSGALLEIQGPLGGFYLQEDSVRPILMIAGGTGFAPCKSMLSYLFENHNKRQVTLYWGARSKTDLYALSLVERWASGQSDFHFVPVLSEPQPEDHWTGRRGRVQEAVLGDYSEFSRHDIYLSGSPAMVRGAHQPLLLKGADPEHIFSDAFEYAPEVRAALEKNAAP
ncbi:MAG TPA: CDP-6-deoxy-delta-3,4-glucoseen reductase [Gammaproteobacteria bacterium]|nr:CDP-6-deoxy-delta-3,4-glucoseen reductase [Gammaproteobacteria bacterium]